MLGIDKLIRQLESIALIFIPIAYLSIRSSSHLFAFARRRRFLLRARVEQGLHRVLPRRVHRHGERRLAILGLLGVDVSSASDERLSKDIRAWLHDPNTTHLFYAFHCYSCKLPATVQNAVKLASLWGAPAFLTEFGTAESGPAASAAGVGWTHYQYNGYCNVPCNGGQNTCRPVPGTNTTCMPGMPCAFGACIT